MGVGKVVITAGDLGTRPEIMGILKSLKPSVGGEIQLTDTIQGLIESGYEVRRVLLGEEEFRLDIGTPSTYWRL